jgi:hypothetical protein
MPLRAADGSSFEGAIFHKIQQELSYAFAKSVVDLQIIRGFDRTSGQSCEQSVRVELDAEGTPENLAFFYKYKVELEAQFGADRVRIVTFPIEVL